MTHCRGGVQASAAVGVRARGAPHHDARTERHGGGQARHPRGALGPGSKLHGLGLNVVKPNRLFGVSGVSWQSCLVGSHTTPSLALSLSQPRTGADPAAANS